MRQSLLRLSCSMLFVAAGILSLPGIARAGVMNSVTTPFAQTLYNPCTNEDVYETGELITSMHLTYDSAGNLTHADLHFRFAHATAVGLTSGRRYRDTFFLNGTANGVSLDIDNGGFCDADTGQCTATFAAHENFISQDGSPNLLQLYHTHITFDPSGNLVVQIYDYPPPICL